MNPSSSAVGRKAADRRLGRSGSSDRVSRAAREGEEGDCGRVARLVLGLLEVRLFFARLESVCSGITVCMARLGLGLFMVRLFFPRARRAFVLESRWSNIARCQKHVVCPHDRIKASTRFLSGKQLVGQQCFNESKRQ